MPGKTLYTYKIMHILHATKLQTAVPASWSRRSQLNNKNSAANERITISEFAA